MNKTNYPPNEFVSRQYVEDLLKQQEEKFQEQLRQQYNHFQDLLRNMNGNQMESPKF